MRNIKTFEDFNFDDQEIHGINHVDFNDGENLNGIGDSEKCISCDDTCEQPCQGCKCCQNCCHCEEHCKSCSDCGNECSTTCQDCESCPNCCQCEEGSYVDDDENAYPEREYDYALTESKKAAKKSIKKKSPKKIAKKSIEGFKSFDIKDWVSKDDKKEK